MITRSSAAARFEGSITHHARPIAAVVTILGCSLGGPGGWAAPAETAPGPATDPATSAKAEFGARRTLRVPGTTVEYDMVLCPGGIDPQTGEPIEALWVLAHEVTWDLYDVYLYELDRIGLNLPTTGETSPNPGDQQADAKSEPAPADAIARPSKPYVPPDRGFGHDGYPAMGMTRDAAEKFCQWLSLASGLEFRIPTPAEFTHLASAGSNEAWPASMTEETVATSTWNVRTANYTTHPVGLKPANAFGLHDTLGNVSEWVSGGKKRIAMGGSYRHQPVDCTALFTEQQDPSWNASDPQIPKSEWWLADCSWVGFRFVSTSDLTSVAPDSPAAPLPEDVRKALEDEFSTPFN